MNDTEFLGMLVVGLCSLLGLISAIVVPLIKLNVTLAKLNSALDAVLSLDEIRDKRINAHSEQLDAHEKILTRHEERLKYLEKGEYYENQ